MRGLSVFVTLDTVFPVQDILIHVVMLLIEGNNVQGESDVDRNFNTSIHLVTKTNLHSARRNDGTAETLSK